MKYKEIKEAEARKCCRQHHKKDKKGIRSMCDVCPLRRTRTDKEGKIHVLFCWFVLKQMYEDIDQEMNKLNEEEVQYNKEWEEYINRQETVEK